MAVNCLPSFPNFFINLLCFSFLSCGILRPADPQFRRIPLQNEEYSGFISRDYFQVVVKVPSSAKPLPIQIAREDCKNRAIQERNRITVALLINEIKQMENDRLRGINQIQNQYPTPGSAGDTSNQGGLDPSGSNKPIAHPLFPFRQEPRPIPGGAPTTNPSSASTVSVTQTPSPNTPESPIQRQKRKEDLLFQKDLSYLQGDFAWFLDSLKLYKEDYSRSHECIFIFRLAENDLYGKLERTKISIRWEDYE